MTSPRRNPGRGAHPTATACALPIVLYAVEAGGRIPVPSRLTYLRSDPYTVRLQCHVGSAAAVTWIFARDLLAAGLAGRAGVGDVRIRPGRRADRGCTLITLHGDDASAVLCASTGTIRVFLQLCESVVPTGAEHDHLDLDALVRRLTQGRSTSGR